MTSHHVSHPIFARLYTRLSTVMEKEFGQHRAELLAGLSGRVVEVGAGNGMNFRHYPASVEEVVAVEPEAYLRTRAKQAAEDAPVPVTVRSGVAEELPLADASFDAAVASLMLCSVSDQPRALAELRRVLRPGGELRFFEHVRATTSLARLQHALDATVWPWFGGGCHTGRDTAGAIGAAGFEIERIQRFRLPDGPVPMPTSPHVLGVARLPAGDRDGMHPGAGALSHEE